MSEIEDTFNRINSHKGVLGIIIVNSDGIPIKTTIEDANLSNQYAQLITSLAGKARHVVRDLDPTNDLTFLRIRSKKHEIMVAPDKDYILIVIQNPNSSEGITA
eukprot:TRINITY_DN18758_c0_g1_i1.p2 TRINITY_DN18758_c0_g1~~TRINITY_DN18758_c0_g1_i1.p2  ORF type:complete len:104 (-),score=36.58 TRINITY_DN18758_c0_g1_i1:47-358(-)